MAGHLGCSSARQLSSLSSLLTYSTHRVGRGQTEGQMAKPKATRPTPAPAGKTQRSASPTQCLDLT